MNTDELAALLAVARKHSERDWLMLLVCFNHGLRIGECLALTRANIVGQHIAVQRLKGSRKTTQPLLPSERDALLELAAKTDGPLFPICRKTAWVKVKKYAAEAGVPEHKAFPHALKHSTGRLAYLAGMGVAEIQTYLGHVSLASTGVYTQAGEDEAAAAFGAAFGGTQ